ncbi:MAG: nucleotidyltransferase domain-containing protein [Bacteroidales bacterium]|jgi:predicted nucleotidyltransferase|nr:nucleotidyltransferase domain-containing protein [Bacteroidales bacterium]
MDSAILEKIRKLKREIIPEQKLILFGSQARGEERQDSDWDLLMLLDKSKPEEIDEDNAYKFVLMGWKLGVYISIKIYTLNEWQIRKPSIFYKNIEQDGIEII